MQTSMQNNFVGKNLSFHRRAQSGFSLLEMVVAMTVLSIGLLAAAQAIGYSLAVSNRGRGVSNAKMLVVSALEQIETLRNTGQLNFKEISNSQIQGSTFRGFPTDFREVSVVPGPDGVFGTADDLSTAPGPDGTYGTGDDVKDFTRARPNVTRQILITELNPLLKKIQVTLRYGPNGGEQKDLIGISYLNDDAHSNYIP
jgi:prepilin-type N-terminal cleavage/methylation domain-containing protein